MAALPFLMLGLAVALQLALVGFTAWSAAGAARAAARADYVGSDPAAAAREALPERLAGGARIESSGEDLEVEVTIPRLLPLLPRLELSAATRLGPEDGLADESAAGG